MIVIKSKAVRNVIKYAVPYCLIPLLIFLGATVFDEKRYLIVSFGVALLTVLLFIAGFERRVVGSRRLVLIAVMIAFCVVGRMIPMFKPITALTVITAIYIGSESGFAVGALSALISNFYFGQGPWTPFQMLGWGLIGLIAGYLNTPLRKSRILLCLYGVLSGIVFSLVMDIWTVVWYNGEFDPSLYLAAIGAAIPHTVIYSVSNVLFLWFLGKPFGDKLERVKIKYGI